MSAQKEKMIKKSIANAVEVAPQGDPQIKNIKDKLIANVVGDIINHPPIEEPTQNKRSPKDNSNLISNFQPLTSDHSRGITLIALVITIIIMLILVTVTITVALKGELFNTAKQSKTETENKINEEQNLASGKVEIDGKWYKSIDDYVAGNPILTIDDYGEFVEYGVDLNNDGNNKNDWKVFYVDEEGRTFIIATDYVSRNNCKALETAISTTKMIIISDYCYYWDSGKAEYNCYDGHNTIVTNDHTQNKRQCSYPDIFMGTGYYCSDHVGTDGKGGNTNSRCASSLMCTDNWSSFVDANYGATYAIGGPTLEMWVASWNQKHGSDKDENGINLYANVNSNNAEIYGYNIGASEDTTETNKDITSCTNGYDDALYFPHQTNENCYGYWLASPSASGLRDMMGVFYNGSVGKVDYFSGSYGLRPLVCIESGVKLVKTVEP